MNGRPKPFYRPWERDRSQFVHAAFAAAAPFYDALTKLFSFGLDGRWRRYCLNACHLKPGETLLDVATGTGELAFAGGRRVGSKGCVVGLDFCREMLGVARTKNQREDGVAVRWVQGKAESLPFDAETFDCVTVGFALRHVADLGGTLKEMVRVLKPGGRLAIVEFTRPEKRIGRFLLFPYLYGVVPPLVGLLSRNRRIVDLARYLPISIERFVSTNELRHTLEAASLVPFPVQRYMAGIVSVCVGVKPNAVRSTMEIVR